MTDSQHGQVVAAAAEVYENFFVPALFGQFAEPLLDATGVEHGHRVLDVGCGTGIVARTAARRVGPDGAVTGLDPNPGMLDVARRTSPDLTWRDGFAEALPFDDGSFDRAVCQFALMFFRDRQRSLGEIARVVAAGGRVGVAVWSPVAESPGYAAMVDLLERLFGEDAASALRAPFILGTAKTLRTLLETALVDVDVTRIEGTARFASIEDWVHTDVRGWTLAELIDDDGEARLLRAARAEMTPFVEADGSVSFAAPALVGTGTVP
ncbi:MAG: methyltransferase domain-containing protein [Acidimicrobiales bacterium]